MAEAPSSRYPPTSIDGELGSRSGDVVRLTYAELDEREALNHVADDGAGANVLFSGTTRDSFKGRQVTKLEYEAYTTLALKTLQRLVEKAHTSAPFPSSLPPSINADPAAINSEDRITRCYVAHRLGEVGVGECSILIAVSSPHRKEAFVVAEWLLEETKKNVAVWKREFYASGQSIEALDGADSTNPSSSLAGLPAANRDSKEDWSWKANFPSHSDSLASQNPSKAPHQKDNIC
ncbi:Molybdopterin biosynthesis MoaE [Testicularia cyperi]|uniref:Molybdopterin biosynthesis MoaE n=1 Tax=Testicularia cyperi TaxID=1882483 RepID=A0A317XRE3_9BASI|nr:Molybdopterin biosynthesis MoaE [Testicularia cyperi]